MKYQHASKNCSFNEIFLITCEDARKGLLAELDKPDKELLEIAFNKHCQILRFDGNSGLCPFMILTVNTWIDRISPTIGDSASEDDPEEESDEEHFSDF